MGSASIDLCCLEQADDVVGTSPWHLRSPTKTWRQAVRHTAAQQFEGHVDSIPSKEQVTLLLKREQRGPQPQHYWDCHSLVMTQEHRALLVLSLNSAGFILGFQFETVALAVNLLDRFAATDRLKASQAAAMPLAAIACMSLAAKLEEANVPDDMSNLRASMPWLGVHEAADVKKMEWLVAAALDWRCLALTPASFLDQLLCDAWQGPLRSSQQADAFYFTHARGFAVKLLSSTLTAPMHLWFAASTHAASAVLVAFQAIGLNEELQDMLLDHWAMLGIQQVEECSEHAAAHLTHVQASQHACLTPAHSQASTIHVPSPSFDYPAGGFGHSRRYIPHEDAGSVCLESASSLTSSSTLF